jgi:hypothetical protein
MRTATLLILLLMLGTSAMHAQYKYQRLAFEPMFSVTKPETDPTSAISFATGAQFRYALSPTFSFNLSYQYGTWENANDKIGRTFFTYFYTTAFKIQVKPGDLFGFEHLTRKVQPYVSLGFTRIQAMASNIRQREKDREVAADFSGGVYGFPAGIGTRIYLSPRFDLFFHVEYLLHNSDSLDGHSLDTRVFNTRNNPDYVWFLNTGLSYKFGQKKNKANGHIDWVSPAREEKEVISNLTNAQWQTQYELDSLRMIVQEMREAQIIRDSILDALVTKMNQAPMHTAIPLDTLSNRMQKDSSLIDSIVPAATNLPASDSLKAAETPTALITSIDTTMIDIIFRAFDSQGTRTDSIANAVQELNDKMNFFLLGYTPKYGMVKTLIETKLREKVPNTKARIIKVIPAGTPIEYTGYVTKGELMDGNPNWYKDVFGNYFWAGSTNEPYPDQGR